jgi:hypothetical protein
VPMKEPGYNHIATIWGFNIYSENTTYNFMRNDECDPSYAKLGWLFQIMDKQVFNVDPKGMRISKRESHLKTYDYIIEDCYWMDYYKVYGVTYTFIGSREYCPTSGYWVDTNPNPNSGNIPHGSGGTPPPPPAKPKPGTEPVVRDLAPDEKKKLDKALEEINKRGCGASMAYDMVGSRLGNYTFTIDPTIKGGGYNPQTNTFSFKDIDLINADILTEEMIHAAQNLTYANGTYQYRNGGNPNIEFEAKILSQINTLVKGFCCFGRNYFFKVMI